MTKYFIENLMNENEIKENYFLALNVDVEVSCNESSVTTSLGLERGRERRKIPIVHWVCC